MSDNDSDDAAEESLAQRRTRRSRGDKNGRLAALEKLKNIKKGGVKNKYEVKELDNVYDVVDEDTYSRKVNDRLKDDWIVDDGTGYCETGHELFDDDLIDDDNCAGPSSRKKPTKKQDKRSKEERENQKSNFLSVRDMLTNMPTKRKREPADNATSNAGATDDMLNEMLQELHEEKKPRTSNVPSGLKLLEKTRAVEKMMSAEKIKEDKQFQPSPKITIKKKFQAHTPIVKIEPDSEPVSFDDTDFEPMDFGTENIEEFCSEQTSSEKPRTIETTAEAEVKRKSVQAPSIVPKVKAELPQTRLEDGDFERYRHDDDGQMETEISCSPVEECGSQQLLNFYWFDIFEEPRNPGVLYLFGKVASQGQLKGKDGYVSCCIVIQNVERCMYILPKEGSSFFEVHKEFENLAPQLKIPIVKARKVEKKFCFGENVPSPAEYLELCYSGTLPPLPDDLDGKSFSRIFGVHSSMLENFLLKKKLKGPCWLQIGNPVPVESGQQQSWCKMEFTASVGSIQIHPKKDSLTIPPFVVASLNVNSVNDANSKKDTIISIAVAVNRTFKIQGASSSEGLFHENFCLLNKPPGEVWPFDVDRVLSKNVTKMDSERSMLACLLAKLAQFDPDIYVGHDMNFDLLLLQLWQHKVPHWSRIGRLKRTSQTHKSGKLPDVRSALSGRLCCDVKISAMELIRARSYDLPSLANQVLGIPEDQVGSYSGAELRQLFETSEGVHHIAVWGSNLSCLNLRLVNELQVMPLALQITTIAGNMLGRTLMGGRSERNEFLLLHAFYNRDYIVPDKEFRRKFKREEDDEVPVGEKKAKSGGPSYAGGLVLDPKKGFYDSFIVLMDFNSLYPSIIQEFNICFTTSTTETNTDESRRGILPEEIRKLVESRREVKKLMQAESASPDLKRQYDIRQKALKLTANSMYGCLGFRNSRFYAKNLASLITGKGRDILMKTKENVEKMGFEVIYGDTDSLMINTNSQDIKVVYQVGNKIKSEINRLYKLLELEIDGVFRFLLLLKKKKYAALTYALKPNGEVETAMELKGLDIVRRDWAPVAATTARSILDEIMSEQPLDDKIFKVVKILSDKAEELRAGSVPIKELLITKQLAKNPEEYKEKQSLYHVQVALRMNKSGKLPKKFKNGDTVSYLFCTDGLPHHPVEIMEQSKTEAIKNEGGDTAISVPEVTKEDVKLLVPDPAYYLSQQMHPVVSRICEPIPGLDAARIAEALGMDPSSYKRKRVVETHHEDVGLTEVTDEEKYRDCARFKFTCPKDSCTYEFVLDSPVVKDQSGEWRLTLSNCPGCNAVPYSYSTYICNTFTLFMRQFIDKYYQGWYMCEDPACPSRERAVNLRLENGYMVCPCQQGLMIREYPDADLYKQLNYFLYSFDTLKHLEGFPKDVRDRLQGEIREAESTFGTFGKLSTLVEKQLAHSAYSRIRLEDVFAELFPRNKFTFSEQKTNGRSREATKEKTDVGDAAVATLNSVAA